MTVNAKSVVISTGSFANNEELMKETLGEDVYANCNVLAGSYAPGVDMMWDIGADKGELLTMNHGVTTQGCDDEVVSQLTLNSPILWVNNQGKRFMNEDLLKDTVEFTSAVLSQGGYAYTIVDQATVDGWTDMSQETQVPGYIIGIDSVSLMKMAIQQSTMRLSAVMIGRVALIS